MTETLALAADVAILLWLIGTWFYEGNHRRCKVTVVCSHCGKKTDTECVAHRSALRPV